MRGLHGVDEWRPKPKFAAARGALALTAVQARVREKTKHIEARECEGGATKGGASAKGGGISVATALEAVSGRASAARTVVGPQM